MRDEIKVAAFGMRKAGETKFAQAAQGFCEEGEIG
jgi:hypothetical protein